MSIWVALGFGLGLAAVVGGNLLGGGAMGVLIQPMAALIVAFGTFGAVLVAFPGFEIKRAVSGALGALADPAPKWDALIAELVELASVARKEGFLALDAYRGKVSHPLISQSVKYLMDGFDAASVRELLDSQIAGALSDELTAARVWEQAGGFAPTMGVVGAILGLIQVLSKLDDPAKLGAGIAVAFVATLYGLFVSNVVLLPLANRMKRLAYRQTLPKEIIKLGILGIQEGQNPHLVEEKLRKLIPEAV